MSKSIWVRYVGFERVHHFEREGWRAVETNPHGRMDQYGILMAWHGEGDPPAETIDDRHDANIGEFLDTMDGIPDYREKFDLHNAKRALGDK